MENLASQRKELIEEMARLQQNLESGGVASDEDMKKLDELQKLLKQYEDQAKSLAKQMREQAERTQLYDLEQAYRDQLKELAEKLEQQAQNAGELNEKAARLRNQPGNAPARDAFRESAKKFEKEQQPFDEPTKESLDQTGQDLAKVRKADELLEQAERLRAVILQQRDLADRMAQFRVRESMSEEERMRAQSLAKEQELLREELESAQKSLEEAAQSAKSELPKMSGDALKLCQKLGELKVGDDQGQSARSARAGEGQSAFDAAESAAKKLESLLSDCCTPKNAADSGDLDGCLQLPKPSLQQSLEQLAGGRSIPGMGQKQGNTGSGFAGSQARTTVYGPYSQSQGESDSQSSKGLGQIGRDGQGAGTSQLDEARGIEAISPETRQSSQSGVGGMRGVPLGYREQAEEYFKRLAEDE
jgi:DNA repair exonuclease SbcCD ATPase subunit